MAFKIFDLRDIVVMFHIIIVGRNFSNITQSSSSTSLSTLSLSLSIIKVAFSPLFSSSFGTAVAVVALERGDVLVQQCVCVWSFLPAARVSAFFRLQIKLDFFSLSLSPSLSVAAFVSRGGDGGIGLSSWCSCPLLSLSLALSLSLSLSPPHTCTCVCVLCVWGRLSLG